MSSIKNRGTMRLNELGKKKRSDLIGEGEQRSRIYLTEELPPLFTLEQEREWGEKLKSENAEIREEARLKFIEHNLRLVVKVAQEYVPFRGTLDFEDLVSEGNMGLLKASENFDIAKGVKFSTYAVFWIKHFMRRALSNISRTVRLPVGFQATMVTVKRFVQEFESKFGYPPHQEAVRKRFKLSKSLLFYVYNFNYMSSSLNWKPDFEDSSGAKEYAEKFVDDRQIMPDVCCSMEDEKKYIHTHVKLLKEREAKIIKMRFGLDGDEAMTLEAIGKVIGVTRERIRQIVDDSLLKMKNSIEKDCEINSNR